MTQLDRGAAVQDTPDAFAAGLIGTGDIHIEGSAFLVPGSRFWFVTPVPRPRWLDGTSRSVVRLGFP